MKSNKRNYKLTVGQSRVVAAIIATLSTAALGLGLGGCGTLGQLNYGDLATTRNVDVERYLGKWYEIARYPNSFEPETCVGVTAEYDLMDNGQISVLNTCRDESGEVTETIEGVAEVVDQETNSKLKVSFFWPFWGAYWIIDLDDDYEYAVVGEPGRQFFWILSRTPTMDQETLDSILEKMPDWSYDPDRLYYVPQQ